MMREALRRLYRRYWRLRVVGALSSTVGLAAALLLAIVWADRLAAFPAKVRLLIALTFGIAMASYVIARAVGVRLISFDHVALCVDEFLLSTRHETLTAWQLEQGTSSASPSPLADALATSHIKEAAATAATVSPSALFPRRLFAEQLLGLVPLPLFLVVMAAFGGWSILPRYFDPYGDHPPYSKLRFTVTPATPRVVYGEDIEVSVQVEGGAVEEVALFTQGRAGARQSLCFRTGDDSFSQRIEKVTGPLKFWFACGQARSRWHHLDLILVPKIVSLKATVTPPDYTLAEPTSFAVGRKPIRALRASTVELLAYSNRPLKYGVLHIKPLEPGERPRRVDGKPRGAHAVVFEWEILRSAELKPTVTDVDGYVSRDDLVLYQEAETDRPPEIFFEEPKPVVLATSETNVAFRLSARDDYGVRDVKLFRCLKNFRETVRSLPIETPFASETRHAGAFDLEAFGVRPGDEIEYFGEASDYNPWGMGLTASDVYRIRVISLEDYLNLMRERAKIEDLENRYRALQEAIREVDEAARELRRSDNKEARKQLQEKLAKALEMLDKLAKAQALYDVEEEFQKEIASLRESFRDALGKLNAGELTKEGLDDFIERVAAEAQTHADAMQERVDLLAKAARVTAMANEFVEIVKQQKLLQRRLNAFRNRDDAKDELAAYAREQKAVEDRLRRFVAELSERVEELPPELERLRESAEKFLDALDELDPYADMSECRDACDRGLGPAAFRAATIAYEKLRSLLKLCEGVGQAAGKSPVFQPTIMSNSLDQLLGGQGMGSGPTAGLGMSGQSGYAASAATAANVQIAGPPVIGGESGGRGQGRSGRGTPKVRTHVERDRRSPAIPLEHLFRFNPNEPFPERYRDQLIDYFKRVAQELEP